MKIYHNPRCSKSRQALQLCEEAGSEVEIIEYLKTPLDEVILKDLLKKLDKPAHEVVRTKEEVYEQLNLSSDSTEEEIIAAIIKYPVLLERPIVVKDDKAVIGRPPENVKVLL
ncbi:MAG: arsenate reductase (glutaredoxin) [Verrucomicrobiota bacterium]|nr:arsenate reductase (glutaredoxin) [Verrucomicrobiota bacterium]